MSRVRSSHYVSTGGAMKVAPDNGFALMLAIQPVLDGLTDMPKLSVQTPPPSHHQFHWRLEILVYSTVTLMSALVVYDGWADLTTFAGAAAVIIAPTVAVAIAHLFAEAVQAHAAAGRTLTRVEWKHLVIDQSQVLLAAVPPLIILVIGWVSPLDARNTVVLLLWTGCITLVGIGVGAAHGAGVRGWRLLAAGLLGGSAGLVVISLQVLLKPH